MADFMFFKECSNYKQIEAACLMVSYGVILEYFTEREKKVDTILNDFRKKNFKLPYFKSGQLQKTLELAVKDYIHNYCIPKNMRGAKYIEQLHRQDEIGTLKDCLLLKCEAYTPQRPLEQEIISEIKSELETTDSLALILYATSSGMHTIVIGYDPENGGYFCKDPNESSSKTIAFPTYDIYEFALFSDYN